MEALILVGALAGLCILIAGAVTDLSLRTAVEIGRAEAGETQAN